MSSRASEADWERKKNYLIRSLFHDLPELSAIRESQELSEPSHHATESVFHGGDVEPLPDLIVERVPKRRNEDESELYYRGLRKRMRRYYRILFNKERDGSSSSDCDDLIYRATYSRAGSDNNVERDLNCAFVEDLEVHKSCLNDSNFSEDETLHLEEIDPIVDHVSSQDNEDESTEIVPAAEETTETEESDESKEISKSVSSDISFGGNDKENIKPGNSLKCTDIDSESTSMESLVLPAPTHQRKQATLLQITGKSMQSNEVIFLSHKRNAEESNHLRKDAGQDKDINDISRVKAMKKQDEEIRKDESVIKENVRDSCGSGDNDLMDTCDTENKEQSGELSEKDITVAPNNNKDSSESADNENSKDNSEEENNKSKDCDNTKNSITGIDSESTSMESLVLPAPSHQTKHASLLQKTGKSMQSNETKILIQDFCGEENNNLRKDAGPDKDISDISRDKAMKKHDEEIRKDESMIKENVRDSSESSDNNSIDTCDTENNEQSAEPSDKNTTVASNNNKDSSESADNENSKDKSEKENNKSKDKDVVERCANTENLITGNEMMMEVEVMRSQNHSPSTQSLEATSNSASPPNVHLERRDEIMLRHSLLSDRDSMEVDVLATRAMDISETSPEDFHPFLRCSTPKPVERDRDNRDENVEVNSSPTQCLQSEQRHDRLTKSLVRKHTSDENMRQSAVEGRDERIEIAAIHFPPMPKTKDKATETSNKEFKNATAQTDERMNEKENVFVDIGVQVQEAEKEVNSVHVQTDEDEDEPFGSQRIFRRVRLQRRVCGTSLVARTLH